MHRRSSFRFANLAVAFCFLLAFTIFPAGSRYAGAQTAAAERGNQGSAQSGGVMTLANHTPQKVLDGTAIRVSHYNPENMLRLTLGVQVPHIAEVEQFTKELVTKGSPNFHKFLTPEEWNARFAPSVEDEQAVVDWAQSVGLTVTRRYPNRLLVDVEGTAGTIEKALGVTINNYQVRDEVDFSNDRDPVIPANLSGIVQTVAGLNNIERVHRIGSRYTTVKGADYVPGPAYAEGFSGQGGGEPVEGGAASGLTAHDSFPLDEKSTTYAMDPDNIQSSEGYDYNAFQQLSHCCNVHNDTTGSPAVSSIALVGYGAYNYSDVTTFFGAYINQAANGSGPCYMEWNLSNILVDGSAPAVDGEAPLDVEYSGAMSNSCSFSNSGKEVNTAHIYEYEMADNSWATYEDAFDDIVSDDYAKVVSTSYGGSEALSGTSNTIETGTMHTMFLNMVDAGWTLIAASGDNGASDGCGDADAVDWPSSDPNVIAAGGTQLNMYTNGTYYSEQGWQGESWTGGTDDDNGACANNHGGSTGGVSHLFAAPAWQTATTTTYPDGIDGKFYLWKGSTEYVETGNGYRVVPDISLTANPDVLGEWYVSGGSWNDEGGTSIVAPELAGFFAQFNTYLNYMGNICGSGTTACTPGGNVLPFIYDAGLYGASKDPFYDMIGGAGGSGGCNNNDITAADDLYYYCTYAGFDLVTGWGSANMMQLAWAINWNLIPAYGEPVITFNDKPTTGVWYNTDQEVSWTVTDINTRSDNTNPPPGVAGFTQAWDTLPADPYSEPHSGEGNSFYSGPEYFFGTTGCLSFNGGFGCTGGSGQGCHTVNVEGWDNSGGTATNTYGPLCYDTVAPTITASANPALTGWLDQSVVLTLSPTDPGGSNASGIKATYYAINNETTCAPGSVSGCSVYSGPVTISAQGQTDFYFFTEDNAGNWSTWWYDVISIDTTKPVTTASLAGNLSSGIYYSAVTVTLNSTTTGGSGVAHTYYTLDGGSQTTYSAPFNVTTAGSHSVTYWSVSVSGETGNSTTTTFKIEPPTAATLTSPAPSTTLLGPSVTFSWAAQTGATTYILRLGTTPGAHNLLASGQITATSITANGLPTNGETIYATLLTNYNNDQLTESYTYTATTQAALTSPANGSVLTGPSETFQWSAATGATGYILRLGTTAGANNIFASGVITATSATPTVLPINGETVYATLITVYGATQVSNSYTFTATTKAALTSPANDSVLTGTSETFDWSAATGATGYILRLGTTVGGTNIFASGVVTATSATPTSLPTNGETVYGELITEYGATQVSTSYTFTAATKAALTSPANASVLTGTSETFQWSAATGGATGYILRLGTTVGGNNIFASGVVTATSATPTSLPNNGETVYGELITEYGAVQVSNSYTFTAYMAP